MSSLLSSSSTSRLPAERPFPVNRLQKAQEGVVWEKWCRALLSLRRQEWCYRQTSFVRLACVGSCSGRINFQLWCQNSGWTDVDAVQLLQAATLPLSLLSKAPQIITNYQNHSTGNLSAFAVFNGLLGCLARLFTTKQEVNDSLIFWGFAAAGLLNAVLAIQMVLYWKGSQVVEAKSALRRMSAKEEGEAEVSPVRVGTEDNGIPGRKWARKLD